MPSTSTALNIFQANINDINDNCGICQEALNNHQLPVYTLKECKHTFHVDCVINWFRTRNNRCPLCGNCGINNSIFFGNFGTSVEFFPKESVVHRSQFMEPQYVERYKMIVNFSKTNDAPKYLKKLVSDINTCKQKWKDASKEYADFKKQTFENKSFQEITKTLSRIKNKRWQSWHRYNTKKLSLLNLPIIPVIIPQYVDYC